MKTPPRLRPLLEDGLIDEVAYQLKSGKEADVYVVRCGDELRCAKIYKEAQKRSFKQAVQYQEGRTGRNSRRNRAMAKSTRFGRQAQEDSWLNAEVDALYRLARVGVRVPKPHAFLDGVLLMEMITDDDGDAAPRLNDAVLTPEQAREFHQRVIADVVRMLCEGLIHGDLSEFNVLLASDGPVIIDLPQAVNAAGNNAAAAMLLRDVGNMADYFGRFAPELRDTRYGEEIWGLYARGALTPDTPLTGKVAAPTAAVDLDDLMQVVAEVRREHEFLQRGDDPDEPEPEPES